MRKTVPYCLHLEIDSIVIMALLTYSRKLIKNPFYFFEIFYNTLTKTIDGVTHKCACAAIENAGKNCETVKQCEKPSNLLVS